MPRGPLGPQPPQTVLGTLARLQLRPKWSDFYATALMKLDAGRHPLGLCPCAQAAIGRSVACAPAPQSLSRDYAAHCLYVRKASVPSRYPSGTLERATPWITPRRTRALPPPDFCSIHFL